MKIETFTAQMATNAQTIRQLLVGVSDEQARWKPDDKSWSMLETINHLYVEEQSDFRVRLDYVLHKPGIEPPKIDPIGWVTEHNYNKRQLEPSLNNFLKEREKSLQWLGGLDKPDWNGTYTAYWRPIRAGDLFAAWVAHDILHMRQLVELHYAWTKNQVQPYQVDYAGEW